MGTVTGGGRVVGTAANGEAGLKLIEDLLPDIVISDIVMLSCTGIQLAEICSHRYPNLKMILLPAYSDFEYAQQAIRLNIVDYVLKPIEPDKLLCAVRRAIDALEEQEGLFSHVSRLENATLNTRQFVSSFLLFESAQRETELNVKGVQNRLDALLQKPGVAMALRCYNMPKERASKCLSLAGQTFLSQMERAGLRVFSRTEDAGVSILCQLPDGLDLTTGAARVEKAAKSAVEQTRRTLAEAEGAKDVLCVCVVTPP